MDFLFIIIILIMSVVIHETAHGYAALFLGDPTAKFEGRLTLNPLSHLDWIGSVLVPLIGYLAGGFIIGWAKPVPFNPYNLRNGRLGEPLVALAGPLANIALALIFGLLIRFLTPTGLINTAFLSLAGIVVLINITLALFNLIPIPPLDGSKILFGFLPYKWHGLKRSLEQLGFFLVIIFVMFFGQFLTPIVSFFFTLLTGLPF